MLWLRMSVGKKQVRLLRSLNVPIIMIYILSAFSLSLLFVIRPHISMRYSPSYVRERSVPAAYKYMYTCVWSAYKWWSNLLLWIRKLSGVVYIVNISGPRTESWGTPQNMGITTENVLIFIEYDTYLLRISGFKWVMCLICHTNQRGDLEEQNDQRCHECTSYQNLSFLESVPYISNETVNQAKSSVYVLVSMIHVHQV